MMRALIASLVLLAASPALACPACASAQRGSLNPLHLVLVLLPFVIGGLATRAIIRALRDDD